MGGSETMVHVVAYWSAGDLSPEAQATPCATTDYHETALLRDQ